MAYRAFYAVKGLTDSTGQPTNALFGFIRMLKQLEKRWAPGWVMVAFDGGSPASRLEKCPEYKAQRSPMPDELRSQLPLITEFLECAGIPSIRINHQEADDVLATLATRGGALKRMVRIATGDKDLMQLVDEHIRLVPPTKADEELDAEGVFLKTGVKPTQIVDWLALIGDTADNIPGVSGIGPKTATKLLAQFGSLENCLAHTEAIGSGTLRQKVREGMETARLNVELMTLDCNVPDVPEWTDIDAPKPDLDRVHDFYERHGLHKFMNEMPPPPKPPPKPAKRADEGQMTLF